MELNTVMRNEVRFQITKVNELSMMEL